MKVKICGRCLQQGHVVFDPPMLLAPREEMRFVMDADYNLKVIEKGFPGEMQTVEFELSLCQCCRG